MKHPKVDMIDRIEEVDSIDLIDTEIDLEAEGLELVEDTFLEEELQAAALGGRLDKWRRDLLDITLRNPLINFKLNRAGIPLICADLEAVEDALAEGGQFQILHSKKVDITAAVADAERERISTDLSKNILRASFGEEDLAKRLTTLYRTARLAIEENGASTLFLALGFLKWREANGKSKKNEKVDRFAPIVLLPIEIVRRSARMGYVIRMSDDQHQVNLSLVEMLRATFKLDITGILNLPEGDKGIDLSRLLLFVREAIKDNKDWEVVEAASIGIFHFSKFVLWNDLNAREQQLLEHPLTSSLINANLDSRLFDVLPDTKRLYFPMPSDASQAEAAKAAAEGRTFVLHGPPGTGKSQTITNIIANALADNKRVLFVAEKMAALNVVRRRLDKIGIGDFCLELHSNKSQKRNFYEQFDRVTELATNAVDINYADSEQKLERSTAELEEFNTAVHSKRRVGESVYGGINRLLSSDLIELGEIDLKVAYTDITEEQYKKGLEQLKLLCGVGETLGEPKGSVFYGCKVVDYSPVLRDEVLKLSQMLVKGYSAFNEALGIVSSQVKNKKNQNLLAGVAVRQIAESLEGALRYKGKGVLSRLMLRIFSKRYKKFKKNRFTKSIKKYVKENANQAFGFSEAINGFVAAERDLAIRLGYDFDNADNWGFEIYCAAEQFAAGINTLRDYCIYNEHYNKCEDFVQLKEIINEYHAGTYTSAEAVLVFERAFWQEWAKREIAGDAALYKFSPSEHELKRARFAALTEHIESLSQKEIYLKLAANLPNFKFASMSSSEPGILLKAVKSRGRGITIRQLLKRIPNLIGKVKPCMLMSPLSVAQFLPEDFPKFDIVIFDEASQMLTSEAVGAICRGRSTIMVGDPNQLPPTTFFATKHEADEEIEFEMQDLESILDDMLTLNILENRLLWHYRSEHESLIAFSNTNYYDSKLVTFPSPDNAVSRVSFVKVDGVYQRGSSRTNPIEARAVVDALFERLCDPKTADLTYGIVTFNSNQQGLIEDLIDKRLIKEASLERHFSGDAPVFVKNIESVQGDERDVIFFSTTYGTDAEGKMTVNFGPINKEGGWRRLNVAITRACKEIVLFSSVTPEMIDLGRTNSKGVKGLKDFMTYAQSNTPIVAQKERDADVLLANSVANALMNEGYLVLTNVGSSTNKVDVAVLNDDGVCQLGILCDSEIVADEQPRDREYGRESFLMRMGWKITRVYALEWWQNPTGETKRIVDILEGATEEQRPKVEIEPNQEIAFNPEVETPSEPYNEITLKSISGDIYQFGNLNQLTAQIKQILEGESPIAEPRLFKAIASAWGVARMTQKYNEYITGVLKRLNVFSNTTQNTTFYWKDADVGLKVFRVGSNRKADEIAKEEYAVAAMFVVENALSILRDDLIRETANLFGFAKTPIANVRIGYALSYLVAQGKLVKEDETYKIKE